MIHNIMDTKYRTVHLILIISTVILGPIYAILLHYLYGLNQESNMSYIFILTNLIISGLLTICVNIALPFEMISNNWYFNMRIFNLSEMLKSREYPMFLYTMMSLLPWNLTNVIAIIITEKLITILGVITLIAFPGGFTFTIIIILYNLLFGRAYDDVENDGVELVVNTAG